MSQHNSINAMSNFKFRLPILVWLLFSALGLLSMTAAATAQGKILIVNSDDTVVKYRQVKDAFKIQMLPYAEHIIDFNVQNDGQNEGLEKLIKDESPDLIYSIGSKAYQLAGQYSGEKPVLFSSVLNWQRFERHSNYYGVANELSLSQELSLLRYVLPSLKRVGVLYDPRFNTERIAEARLQMAELSLNLVEKPITDAAQLDSVLKALLPSVDVLWLIADPGVLADRAAVEQIFASAAQYKKPVYTYSDAFSKYGASLIVSADTPTMGRQAANMAQAILQREPIKEAIQTPAGSHITLNACQLGKLNMAYNPDALDAINQLLECQ
jgi:putative ABC transport system substrate-binding protein